MQYKNARAAGTAGQMVKSGVNDLTTQVYPERFLMQIVFEPPSKDSPGFLKRLKKAMAFQDAINSKNVTEKTIDDLVDFLSVCIKNETPEKAKELLLDASEAQFNEMLQSITGQEDTKKNENKSGSVSKEPTRSRHR